MAKNKNFIGLLFCALICICSSIKGAVIPECNQCCCNATEVVLPLDLRSQVISVAESQVGVKESTGNNDGSQIMEYQHATGNNQGDQWCASFIAWVYQKVGLKATGSAYSPSWFPKNKIIYKPSDDILNHPEAGDVFGVWVQSKGRVGHVGIIVSWNDDFVTCIEGNYGDQVSKTKRIRKQIYVASDWINNQSTI